MLATLFPRRSGRRRTHQLIRRPERADGQPGRRHGRRFTQAYLNERRQHVAARRPSSPTIEFQNGMVGLQVKSLGGDFSQFQTQLTDVGMQITDSSSYLRPGRWLRPDQRRCRPIAEMPQTMSGQVDFTSRSLRQRISRRWRTTRPKPRCTPTRPAPSSTSTEPA